MTLAARLHTLQFLDWLAARPRAYGEVTEAWHSCPHLSAFEDALADGLVAFAHGPGGAAVVLTPAGRAARDALSSPGPAPT
ncbi:MAG TPA: hypothetical protein VFA22_11760 [Stellaceae bacterium]|nr:hypothetical protein [Stellaceae bacterium]